MTGLPSLSRALLLGFVRDRTAMFFTVLFPLIFLFIVGGIFRSDGTPRSSVVVVGRVDVVDSLPAPARADVERVLKIVRTNDLADALARVRKGDEAAAVEQRGDEVIVHYTAADQVAAGTVRSVLASLVQGANLTATGRPARYKLLTTTVEDASLKRIQYLTPGILGWAVATGAVFAGSSTLVLWRRNGMLRRLRLSPVSAPAVYGGRVLVSLGVALAQTVLFLVVGAVFFGLRLTGSWWMSIPLILVGTLVFLAIGLLAGALSRSVEAANLLSNLVIIPMAFLSGSFFPLELGPSWLRTVSVFLPLSHLNNGMLGVLARGTSPVGALPELAALLGFAVVIAALALFFFRWDDDA
jgi:ABC-2 type transport system permease protein